MNRPIKSFVLRTGRISPRQKVALEEYLPQYELTIADQAWDLNAIFGRQADTVVEIGFGMGQSLMSMAKAAPEINFIGIEVHRAGIGSIVAELHDQKIENVRIAPFDAVMAFNTCLLDEQIAGVQLFFPDPWPKKRHQKRRLVQPDFIHLLVSKIKSGGFLHCATDWEEYAEQMLAVLSAEPLLKNANLEGGYMPRPDRRPLTKFEQRGQRLGHGVWDLIFLRCEA